MKPGDLSNVCPLHNTPLPCKPTCAWEIARAKRLSQSAMNPDDVMAYFANMQAENMQAEASLAFNPRMGRPLTRWERIKRWVRNLFT